MKISTYIIIISGLLLWSGQIIGQDKSKESRKREVKGVVFNKELSGHLMLHTNGFSLGATYGLLKTYYKTTLFQVEISEIKHPKEYVDRIDFTSNGSSNSPRSFTYGKQNSFLGLHVGYGEKRYLTDKARKRGVAIGINYLIGPSLGLVKPYYLELSQPSINGLPSPTTAERYSEENASNFLNKGFIKGGAGFVNGLGEMSFIPGGHIKAGLHLDWGAYDQMVKALEVGFTADVYAKKVPIMIIEDNTAIFFNFYIAMKLGKRW